jgi:hypothetical protein
MLKTRLAHGYCSCHPAAGACPCADICENCDNSVPADDAVQVLRAAPRHQSRGYSHPRCSRGTPGRLPSRRSLNPVP